MKLGILMNKSIRMKKLGILMNKSIRMKKLGILMNKSIRMKKSWINERIWNSKFLTRTTSHHPTKKVPRVK